MERFEIYLVCLDPTVGAEMKKTRPCVIVTPDEMNRPLQTVTVVPVTSTSPRTLPTRIKIKATATSGLKDESYAVLDQIKTIDKSRCVKRLGKVSDAEAKLIADTLCKIFEY